MTCGHNNLFCTHPGENCALLEGIKVKLEVLLAQSWDINIIEAMKTDGSVQSLWPDGLYHHCEPLWSSQPVFHRQHLSVGGLTWDLLHYGRHILRRLSRAHEVVQQPRPVRLREEDRAVMLLLFCGHGHRLISELVVASLAGLYAESVWACPVLTIYDRVQEPGRMGLVVNTEVTDLFTANSGSEMQHLRQY